jgi:hypothetical protein
MIVMGSNMNITMMMRISRRKKHLQLKFSPCSNAPSIKFLMEWKLTLVRNRVLMIVSLMISPDFLFHILFII